MKTTIELPDDLLAEAKATAAKRRTTLKALFERALRRELAGHQRPQETNSSFRIDEHGLPVLIPSKDSKPITTKEIYQMMEDLGI